MIPGATFLKALESVGCKPNKVQSAAVSASKPPLFVVAGPGTGKTACLTMRMLIGQHVKFGTLFARAGRGEIFYHDEMNKMAKAIV